MTVERERAIEVMPNHATPETVAELHALGFDYVSLGIQSFDPRMLRHLGRLNTAGDNRRALEATVGSFGCVNADLIFDVAFVEPDVFLRDLETCCRSGVDQISTYPLMHFGFTPFGKAAHDPGREHELLRRACELADGLGYERRAVWTFTRRGGPLYASIARELYLGCGAGAATFTGTDFLVNHFGLGPYEAGARRRTGSRSRVGRASIPVGRRFTTPSGSSTRRASTSIASGSSFPARPGWFPSWRCFGERATSSRSTAACVSPSVASTATTTWSGGSPTT